MKVRDIYEMAMSGHVPEKRISLESNQTHRINRFNAKAILQYDSNGILLNVFRSAVEAEKVIGISAGSISKCCHGKMPYAGKAHYVFRFAEE